MLWVRKKFSVGRVALVSGEKIVSDEVALGMEFSVEKVALAFKEKR